jgi:flagellar biosynthesis protein FlhF
MNVKRFTARTARDALALVKQAFGEDAAVLSTKPVADGVEVLAMAPEAMQQIERLQADAPRAGAAPARDSARKAALGKAQAQSDLPEWARTESPAAASSESPAQDAERLSMSTLSFQDYVRNRMLKRRQAAIKGEGAGDSRLDSRLDSRFADSRFGSGPFEPSQPESGRPEQPRAAVATSVATQGARMHEPAFDAAGLPPLPGSGTPAAARRAAPAPAAAASAPAAAAAAAPRRGGAEAIALAERMAMRRAIETGAAQRQALADDTRAALAADLRASGVLSDPPVLRDEFAVAAAPSAPATPRRSAPVLSLADADAFNPQQLPGLPAEPVGAGLTRRDHDDMLRELRAMKGLIEERFGALAFMERLQKQPKQATLTQRLLDCGFSPALTRKLSDALSPVVADEVAWASGVLERNLATGENEPPLEEQGGVVALIGATGVGKTTSTAKLAAAFATRHGAGQLGLITLDAYRMGAHEQLRAYGRILGVSVHTAHDRASLEDLLDLLSAKRMVLIDTAGMAQRDSRTAELLDMLGHASIRKLLVINAAAQGETTEDVMAAYRAGQCCGVVLSKIDEAVKLAPALDALIRHRVKVLAVANGQRVPEDWHRLSAQALVQRALKTPPGPAYRYDVQDVNLVFTAASHAASAAGPMSASPANAAARQPQPGAGTVAATAARNPSMPAPGQR